MIHLLILVNYMKIFKKHLLIPIPIRWQLEAVVTYQLTIGVIYNVKSRNRI